MKYFLMVLALFSFNGTKVFAYTPHVGDQAVFLERFIPLNENEVDKEFSVKTTHNLIAYDAAKDEFVDQGTVGDRPFTSILKTSELAFPTDIGTNPATCAAKHGTLRELDVEAGLLKTCNVKIDGDGQQIWYANVPFSKVMYIASGYNGYKMYVFDTTRLISYKFGTGAGPIQK